ncbi:MAG: hypothetical protein ACK5VX_06845 [Akkermansiaceae bacterium]
MSDKPFFYINTNYFLTPSQKDRKRKIEEEYSKMKTIINQTKLKRIKAAAAALAPNAPLKGQADVAITLRDKGYSIRAISQFLGDHGLPVSPTAISHFFQNSEKGQKNNK